MNWGASSVFFQSPILPLDSTQINSSIFFQINLIKWPPVTTKTGEYLSKSNKRNIHGKSVSHYSNHWIRRPGSLLAWPTRAPVVKTEKEPSHRQEERASKSEFNCGIVSTLLEPLVFIQGIITQSCTEVLVFLGIFTKKDYFDLGSKLSLLGFKRIKVLICSSTSLLCLKLIIFNSLLD